MGRPMGSATLSIPSAARHTESRHGHRKCTFPAHRLPPGAVRRATLPAPVRRSRARPGPVRSATGRGPRSGRRGCDSDHEALPGHDQVGHLPGEGRPAARGRRRAPPRRVAAPSERCSCTRRRNVESPPVGGNQPLVTPGRFVVTTGIGDFWTPTSFANFPICRPRPSASCDSLHPVNPLTGTAS